MWILEVMGRSSDVGSGDVPRRACRLRLRFDNDSELQIAHCHHQTSISCFSRDVYWLTRSQICGRHTHADAVRALLSPQLQLRPRHSSCQLCTGSVIGRNQHTMQLPPGPEASAWLHGVGINSSAHS